MIRSIRLTLSLWYIGILAVILCLFSWVLYTNVAINLARSIDEVLASEADGVADAIFAFWEARWEAGQTGATLVHGDQLKTLSRAIEKDVEEGHLSNLVTRWAEETGELETVHPIRLIGRGGQPLIASASFENLDLPLTATTLAGTREGKTVYETFNLPPYRVRLITRPVIEAGRVLYLVQMTVPLRQADSSLERLRLWLLWLTPSTLVVTSAIGWFLATTALKPVGRIITQAQRIGAEDLHERIDVPHTGDELERLATTFNDMLARLGRAFRRLRQFSAAASHELRTPLTVMKGELEVALRKSRDTEEYQRVLRTHLEAINEMIGIVEQLLMLGRSETGKEAIEWRPVELTALARQVRESLWSIAESKKIRVDIPTNESIWVRGERRLLERLLTNLLENALKHTPSEGCITLRVESQGLEACLNVKDTGPGIPLHELPEIFDQFFSRRSSANEAYSTGLGLGLCRWIAEAHQGHIEAANLPGQGASFTVWLPRLLQ